MFTVYVLQSESDGGLYIGLTSDPTRRLEQHNRGHERSTRTRRPFRLIYSEEHESRLRAREREKYLKSGAGREFLKTVPGWRNRQTQRT